MPKIVIYMNISAEIEILRFFNLKTEGLLGEQQYQCIFIVTFFCSKIPSSTKFFFMRGGIPTSICMWPMYNIPFPNYTNGCKSQFLRHFNFAGKDTDSSGYDLRDKNNVTDVAKRIRDSSGLFNQYY